MKIFVLMAIAVVWFFSGIILFNIKPLEEKSDAYANKCPWLIPFMIIFLPLVIVLACLSLGCKSLVSKFVSSLTTPFKGEFGMKWFLFRSLFLVAFGFTASETQMVTKAWQWWTAPPPPPSAEAQKLIASLKNADGWKLDHLPGKVWPRLISGETRIDPNGWSDFYHADVWVNDTRCNSHFDGKDLRAINDAAEVCLRKLTAKAMNDTVADSR